MHDTDQRARIFRPNTEIRVFQQPPQIPNPNVLELGCFAGFNLSMAAERVNTAGVHWIGIEPNRAAVDHGKRHLSEIEFHQGSHDDMIAGRINLPARIEVCLISRVCMILHPEAVRRIIGYLTGRVRRLIICDDIFNADGDMAIVRMPDFILMHPFGKVLAEAGFEIEKMIRADVPDRECTGFIVAKSEVELED